MYTVPVSLALLATASLAEAGLTLPFPLPPIFNKLTPAKYEASIKVENLLGHSKKLWQFATLPGANTTRSFGTKGYNASADYLYNLVQMDTFLSYCQVTHTYLKGENSWI